ncbi:MAG: hypothetical protein MMC23_000985 [Stictis urceolatum]|nr:hypothetical protein [Stictis urceolata]
MAEFQVDHTTRSVEHSIPHTSHRLTKLNGTQYHFLYSEPKTGLRLGTAILIHGFQDISFGWRFQIPALVEQQLRVVAIDCIGYGGTDAPSVPPDSIRNYTFKQAADDIKELVGQLGEDTVILGGHDWGGLIVARVAEYHPQIVAAIFSAGTPYLPVEPRWLEFSEYVEKYPTFKYQGYFGGSEFEKIFKTDEDIRQFMIAGFYGKGPNGELPFSTERPLFENWPILKRSEVISEDELEYYTQEYARHGMHAPLNWYRNRCQNFEDERALLPPKPINVPYLFIQSLKDPFLPPSMSQGMEDHLPQLRRREVETGHFSLILDPQGINKHVSEWLQEAVLPIMRTARR